jgi:HEAT repeat protein
MRASGLLARFAPPSTRLLARFALLCSALVVSSAGPAGAEPAKTPKATKPARVDVAPIVAKLKSGDDAQVRAALDDLKKAQTGGAAAAPAVADVLSRGLGEALTQQAIETLADLESAEGSPVLAQYATHRTVTLRRAAVKALTRTKGPTAQSALRHALGDPDPQVRGVAASGLGALKARDAVPDLFVALDHKVNEAAVSIGQLCVGDQCDALASKLGKLPFDVVTTGLDQVIFRPASDINDDLKIKVLGRLRELGTAEANKFLKEVQGHLPKETSARIRQAVEQAVKATAGGSQ